MPRSEASATLLYDADCAFCRWTKERICAWDRAGRIRAVSLQSAEAAEMLRAVDPAKRMESWHLITSDGRVHSAGDGVAPLARLLPLGTPIATLAATFPKTTDRLYDVVARTRGKLSRLVRAR
ncbi:MAG: thiol-disulfide oxidoreductase DCC family protein [Actinomycetota bacterium]